MKTTNVCMRLVACHIVDDDTIDDYIQRTHIDEKGIWGSRTEMYVLARMTGLNIFSLDTQARRCEYILYYLGV